MSEMVYSLAVCDDVVFSALSDGLVKSMDCGLTWEPVFAGKGNDMPVPATAVALSPQFDTDRMVFAAVSGGVLRSQNGGVDWEAGQLPGPAPMLTALAFSASFEHDRMLFAATLEDGVFRSLDAGSTWVSWNFGLLDFQVLCIAVTHTNQLYAGTATGLFVSTNEGRAWSEIALPCGNVPVLSLAVSGDVLLAGTEEKGLYFSRDAGHTWIQLAAEKLETVNVLLATGETILAGSGNALHISFNAGQNWDCFYRFDDEEEPAVIALSGELRDGVLLLAGSSKGNIFRIPLAE